MRLCKRIILLFFQLKSACPVCEILTNIENTAYLCGFEAVEKTVENVKYFLYIYYS